MALSGKTVNIKNTITRSGGFTLIELMAVVAIVSILAVIAIPAYLDYVVRSKVSEGMVFVSEAKTSVSEYYYSTKEMAENNNQAGLSPPDDYDKPGGFIKKLEISSAPTAGYITITFKIPGSSADGKELQLIPATTGGLISWTCTPPADNGISVNQIPPNCRG
ncbi:MAG: prepilin-type cleavage/methylation domain-containing protein [Gammaproteobacteria bacterium]|nr:MAG: prepilin-type cleavage/methylation domain-containing protein [Gammaproteobacteria bacterium]